jgi:hypothetical protein
LNRTKGFCLNSNPRRQVLRNMSRLKPLPLSQYDSSFSWYFHAFSLSLPSPFALSLCFPHFYSPSPAPCWEN